MDQVKALLKQRRYDDAIAYFENLNKSLSTEIHVHYRKRLSDFFYKIADFPRAFLLFHHSSLPITELKTYEALKYALAVGKIKYTLELLNQMSMEENELYWRLIQDTSIPEVHCEALINLRNANLEKTESIEAIKPNDEGLMKKHFQKDGLKTNRLEDNTPETLDDPTPIQKVGDKIYELTPDLENQELLKENTEQFKQNNRVPEKVDYNPVGKIIESINDSTATLEKILPESKINKKTEIEGEGNKEELPETIRNEEATEEVTDSKIPVTNSVPKKKNNKWKLGLLLLIGLIMTLGGAYWIWNYTTKNQTGISLTQSVYEQNPTEVSEAITSYLAVINDPDGYTNLREGPSTKRRITAVIKEDEPFMVLKSGQSDWWYVINQREKEGYMHKSRVQLKHQILLGDFPKASMIMLKKEDLRGRTKNDLSLIRNEIFARYGYVFKRLDLQEYFNQKNWYQHLDKLDYSLEDYLTNIEKANIKLIQSLEAANFDEEKAGNVLSDNIIGDKNDLQEATVYSWIEKLNVRKQPNLKARIVYQMGEDEQAIFLGKKSDHKIKITLRGKDFNEPWLYIKTKSGLSGWVHGGAVRFLDLRHDSLEINSDEKELTTLGSSFKVESTNSNYKTIKGASFTANFPASFEARPSMQLGEVTESVFFFSAKADVRFYAFFPIENKEASDIAFNPAIEKITNQKTSKKGNKETMWIAYQAKNKSYTRSYKIVKNLNGQLISIVGIKFKNLQTYQKYEGEYKKFKKSLNRRY